MNASMSVKSPTRLRPLRLDLHHARIKQQQTFEKPPDVTNSSSPSIVGGIRGILSPNLQPPTPPILSSNQEPLISLPSTFGEKYVLLHQVEASNLYRCIHKDTAEEYVCKVVYTKKYHEYLSGHIRLDGHPGINLIVEVVIGPLYTYIVFAPSYGDLHSYVRNKKRLHEREAARYFHQMASIVADCHDNGIILRDLKLRKFVFANRERTQLKLETLDDAITLDEDSDNDVLSDKHGCPAYVSPEILVTANGQYSGRASDCWSMGVILYTMLVGRYPFHDADPAMLFCKIRRGNYFIPDSLSSHAKCLIRSLLRRDPSERLTAEEVLSHKWFKQLSTPSNFFDKVYLETNFDESYSQRITSGYDNTIPDQTVPEIGMFDCS